MTAFAFILLSALQLGLSTTQLRTNAAFNRASFGFAVFSMVFCAAIIGAALMLFLFLFIFYECSARGFQSEMRNIRHEIHPQDEKGEPV
jgi:hypothetical protein